MEMDLSDDEMKFIFEEFKKHTSLAYATKDYAHLECRKADIENTLRLMKLKLDREVTMNDIHRSLTKFLYLAVKEKIDMLITNKESESDLWFYEDILKLALPVEFLDLTTFDGDEDIWKYSSNFFKQFLLYDGEEDLTSFKKVQGPKETKKLMVSKLFTTPSVIYMEDAPKKNDRIERNQKPKKTKAQKDMTKEVDKLKGTMLDVAERLEHVHHLILRNFWDFEL